MNHRLDNLTSLRFYAALSIFLGHMYELNPGLRGVNIGLGVSFFFVLSGFVLSYAYDGGKLKRIGVSRFVIQRFFRLWPLHIVCGGLALFTLGGAFDATKAWLFVTLQHSWTPVYTNAFFVNPPSWTISVDNRQP